MTNHNFVQKKELFSFNATRCLRNEYFHNDCRICIDLCPKNAIDVVRNKLTIFNNECIECAGCIGSCPTESFEIESFDPNEFCASFANNENKEISCKSTTPCLGVFDTDHFLVMALRSDGLPRCDLSHCEGCPLNSDGNMEQTIRSHISYANDFLLQIGADKTIEIVEKKLDDQEGMTRRALFRKGFEKAKEAMIQEVVKPQKSMTSSHHAQPDMRMPLKRILLKNSLKEFVGSMSETRFADNSPLFFNKVISFDACTNCGDCTQFCPTDALFPTSDKQGIYFAQGKCIGCGICEHICKTNAISPTDGFDMVSIAYDRAVQLVHYDMVMCRECRSPFPYKGGDPICTRCESYTKEFSNMFTLARDM
jgi:ferredoxin